MAHFKTMIAFVVSQNLHRRHLTASQRAVLAEELMPMLEEETKERQREALARGNRTRHESVPIPELIPESAVGDVTASEQPSTVREEREARGMAAKVVGVNPRYVSDVRRVKEPRGKGLSAGDRG